MLVGNCWFASHVGAEPPANSKHAPATAAAKDSAQEELDRYVRKERENPKFPEPDEVVSIEAEPYGHPMRPLAPDIKPFLIPKKYYGKLLGFFRHAELDKEPDSFDDELGTILIVSERQGYVRICSGSGRCRTSDCTFLIAASATVQPASGLARTKL
jgi:hypothetical protein